MNKNIIYRNIYIFFMFIVKAVNHRPL